MLSVNMSSRYLGQNLSFYRCTTIFEKSCHRLNILFFLCCAQLDAMNVFSTYVLIKITAACGLMLAVTNRAVYERIVC